MKRKNTMKHGLVMAMVFTATGFVAEAQWAGSTTTTTGDLYRSGNVGIGDNNFGGLLPPAASLHVRNTGSVPFMVERYNGVSNQNNSLKISFSSSTFTGAGSGTMAFQMANPYSLADMAFMNSTSNVAFVVKANGNFGIGTVSPGAKFAVSDGTSSQLRISGNVAGDIESTGGLTFHYNSANSLSFLSGSTNRFQIASDGSTMLTPNGGTVSIGTTSPNNLVKLHVAGDMLVTSTTWPASAAFIRANSAAGDPTRPEYTWWGNDRTGIYHPVADAIGFTINGSEAGRITTGGKFLMGDPANLSGHTSDAGYNLFVEKGILTQKVRVLLINNWPDYVFADDFKLESLSGIESYIKANKHLPGVPSAEEVEKNGIDVAEMNAVLLKKVEELTLHVIELDKKNKELEEMIKNK